MPSIMHRKEKKITENKGAQRLGSVEGRKGEKSGWGNYYCRVDRRGCGGGGGREGKKGEKTDKPPRQNPCRKGKWSRVEYNTSLVVGTPSFCSRLPRTRLLPLTLLHSLSHFRRSLLNPGITYKLSTDYHSTQPIHTHIHIYTNLTHPLKGYPFISFQHSYPSLFNTHTIVLIPSPSYQQFKSPPPNPSSLSNGL